MDICYTQIQQKKAFRLTLILNFNQVIAFSKKQHESYLVRLIKVKYIVAHYSSCNVRCSMVPSTYESFTKDILCPRQSTHSPFISKSYSDKATKCQIYHTTDVVIYKNRQSKNSLEFPKEAPCKNILNILRQELTFNGITKMQCLWRT